MGEQTQHRRPEAVGPQRAVTEAKTGAHREGSAAQPAAVASRTTAPRSTPSPPFLSNTFIPAAEGESGRPAAPGSAAVRSPRREAPRHHQDQELDHRRLNRACR
jgi:hypothetical protein